MQTMTSFIENFPLLAAILVAVVTWLAIAFELLGLKEKVLAICTTLMGFLAIVATFGGAQRAGSFSAIGVVVTLICFSIASAWVWSRWGKLKDD